MVIIRGKVASMWFQKKKKKKNEMGENKYSFVMSRHDQQQPTKSTK